MRYKLTYHKLPWARFIISAAVSLSCDLYIQSTQEHKGVTNSEIAAICTLLFSSGIAVITLVSLFNLWMQKRRIEFDENNMYLIRKGRESVIPLKNITEIAMTGSSIKEFYRWYDYRITFTDTFGEMVYVKFWNITRHSKLDLFQANVRKQNNTVEIKNWATSLDPIIDIFRKGK